MAKLCFQSFAPLLTGEAVEKRFGLWERESWKTEMFKTVETV
ncbi:MAG: hypothetical protein QXM00_06150 [Candidatus Bathyarchaeia archaeon]